MSSDLFEIPQAKPKWSGEKNLGFLGRFNESRKGLELLIKAFPKILDKHPNAKVLVAGPGEKESALKLIPQILQKHFIFLGPLSEEDKVSFFKSISIYVAPNTGGESFGIILAEAIAAGAPIVASDIPAFRYLLDDGKYGALFESENPTSLAHHIIDLLKSQEKRENLRRHGLERAERFDWSQVSDEIMNVYLHARGENEKVLLASESRTWNRFFSREGDSS